MNLLSKTRTAVSYEWKLIPIILLLISLILLLPSRPPSAQAGESTMLSMPQFSLPSGYYDTDQQLAIRLPEPIKEGQIIFTTDGSTPDRANGTIYAQPIHLVAKNPATAVVRAREFAQTIRQAI